jgi:hypothetical protein
MERMFWLLRHEGNTLVKCWWIGFQFEQKGRSFERAVWEVRNNVYGANRTPTE